MRKYELNITSSDYIVASIEDDAYFEYIKYNKIIEEIHFISLKIKEILIESNKIIFKTDKEKVTINNYKNNTDIKLQKIIDEIIEEKKRIRKEYLKNKKIKRIKKIAVALTLAITLTNGIIYAKNYHNNKFSINSENILVINEEKKEIKTEYEIMENETNIKEDKIKKSNEKHIDIELVFEDRTNTEKYRITKAYYENFIKSISKEYGIDYKIMLAIATQESGVHKTKTNTPAIGLMQIEKAVWNNKKISAYNFEKKHSETLTITEDKLKDLEFNIRVSCMHLQNCLKNSKYNLPVAIQMYNFGYGNVEKTFKNTYNKEISIDEVLDNYNDDWLDYRALINEGDSEYLEHVLSYIEDYKDIKCIDEDGSIISYNVRPKKQILK